MVISLLIGNLLLVAIACSNPMYQNAALQKTLQSKLNRYIQEENANPGILTFESNQKGNEGQEEEYRTMPYDRRHKGKQNNTQRRKN